MELKQKCWACGSWRWCGKTCQYAPAAAAVVEAKPPAPSKARRSRVVADHVREVKRLTSEELPHAAAPQSVMKAWQDDQANKPGRPPSGKERIAIRLSKDVLARFRATGDGWQGRINEALRKAVGL